MLVTIIHYFDCNSMECKLNCVTALFTLPQNIKKKMQQMDPYKVFHKF